MRLCDWIYLVGSGAWGVNLSDAYDCNVYLIFSQGRAALIDSGMGIQPEAILSNAISHGISPSQIETVFVTHCHGDHIGGLSALKEGTGAKVASSKLAADVIRKGDERTSLVSAMRRQYPKLKNLGLKPCVVDQEVEDGNTFNCGSIEITALATPGHSEDHMAYLLKKEGTHSLFSGDCVFYGGTIMLQNIPGCSVEAYAYSLNKLREQKVDSLFPGHMIFDLRTGGLHIKAAAEAFNNHRVPPNVSIPHDVLQL